MKLKTIVFNHLGFPIILEDWPHLEVDGRWEPDVNYEALEKLVFEVLSAKPSLTDAEMAFKQTYLRAKLS